MQAIDGILFEPVGCLAEFPAAPFNELAARLSGRRKSASKSGSRSYWHLLNVMETAGEAADAGAIEALEMEAVAGASVYEDVLPALAELKTMGVKLCIASSLSSIAVARFLEISGAGEFFSAVWSRNNSGGIKAAPLRCAMTPQSIFLTDTAEGLKAARSAGVNCVLMMNDPDEARRLAMRDPAGGIVSLHELPDFIRLVAAENARPAGR